MLLGFAASAPEKALEWAAGVSDLGADVGAVPVEIGAAWVKDDLKGLSVWLSSNPRHTMHDELTLSLIQEIAPEDPEAARAWLETIEDSAIRHEAATLAR